ARPPFVRFGPHSQARVRWGSYPTEGGSCRDEAVHAIEDFSGQPALSDHHVNVSQGLAERERHPMRIERSLEKDRLDLCRRKRPFATRYRHLSAPRFVMGYKLVDAFMQ